MSYDGNGYKFNPDRFRASIEYKRRELEAREGTAGRGTMGASKPWPVHNTPIKPPGAYSPPGEPAAELTRASALRPEPVRWLWHGWLARGKMHVLAGQPGAGKTTVAMKMAAVVSTGGHWPDGTRAPVGNVIIWTGEDDPADTLTPRLIAAGGNANRVYFLSGVTERGERRPFDPARDAHLLNNAIKGIGGCELVIVDPLVSAVAADSHKNAETRRALQPLVDMAAAADAALLGITHLSKGTAGREPIERVTGSLAFGALARIVMIAGRSQQGEGDGPASRFLGRAKSNIGPDEGGYAYQLQVTSLPEDERIRTCVAVFGERIEGSVRDMLAEAEAEPEGGAREEAEKFLAELLIDGPVPVAEIRRAAEAYSFCWRTVESAKKALGIVASRKGGLGQKGNWAWSLPESACGLSDGACGLSDMAEEGL